MATRLPITSLDELVAAKRAGGDPFAGRLRPTGRVVMTVQLDEPSELPLYLALGRGDLERYAEALRRSLTLLGARTGDVLAIYDYGSSPVAYLASRFFTAYLRRGAADALGCTVVCNDGGANMAGRAAELLASVRPDLLLMRADCVEPLLAACEGAGIRLDQHTKRVVITQNHRPLPTSHRKRWARRLDGAVAYLPRVDVALFLAAECPRCRAVHIPPDLYDVEVVEPGSLRPLPVGGTGQLVITSRFTRISPAPRMLTHLIARLLPDSCPRVAGDLRAVL